MTMPTLGLLLTAALIFAGRPTAALPVSEAQDATTVVEDPATPGQKPAVITTGDVTNPQTIIIDVPPRVDAAGATDTSREEVETHKRVMKSLGVVGTEGNEVPVRQSSLELAVAAKLRSECARRTASACLKLKLLTYMNRLLKKASISITDAVEISQTSEEVEENDEEEVRQEDLGEEALGEVVAEKVAAFVRTRSLRWKALPEADLLLTPSGDGTVEVGVSVRGGRAADKGRGKLKNLLPILGAVKIKLGILVALAIAALALLVGKAVLVSKIALLLAGILGIIKLLSKPQKSVSYEVVSHPHHTHSHGSSSTSLLDHHEGYPGGGYGRSIDGHSLAYRAHLGDGDDLQDGDTASDR